MSSIWSADIRPREALKRDVHADVAVIGAGMAGLLIADRLKRRGLNVIVLEASSIASGQTKITTAKITSQHGMIYDSLINKFGLDAAKMYARANELAIREYADIIAKRDIDCDFSFAPAYLYSRVSAEPLITEAHAARKCGIDASYVTETELPFTTAGGVRFNHQARFHPLKFISAISQNLDVFEHTRALKADGNDVITPRGAVRAEHIVFATHYPFVNAPGYYFMRMHQERSYVLALESDWLPEGMYYGVDAGGLSFREAKGLLLVSGGGHRTGENSAGGQYAALSKAARDILPNSIEVAKWSAQDCITLDGVPYIGQFSRSTPNWHVATGFGKWGMSLSMVSAMAICGRILGNVPEWSEVFSPLRFKLSASAKSLVNETAQSVKGLSRRAFTPPRAALDELPNGHGGIVELDGRKAGVYKDEGGKCHVIDPRCPHLGCQLEWNPEELSWDCPCHGSRFTFTGELIDDPAQEGV